jgi:hypothetical protein
MRREGGVVTGQRRFSMRGILSISLCGQRNGRKKARPASTLQVGSHSETNTAAMNSPSAQTALPLSRVRFVCLFSPVDEGVLQSPNPIGSASELAMEVSALIF